MHIASNGTVPSLRASEKFFTGVVTSTAIVNAPEPARVRASLVSFLPGARTAWHFHPYGQTLYVTAGAGLIQLAGEPAHEIKAGDSVWIGPGERHWHGATALTAMSHVAVHEHQDGNYATWLEHVSEQEYTAAQPQTA